MTERPMDASVGAAPAAVAGPVEAPPRKRLVSSVIEWLFGFDALAAARAQLNAETPEHKALRQKSRALFDAAQQLTVNAQRAPEAEAALHLEALRACNEPAPEPSKLAAAHEASLAKLEAAVRAYDGALRLRLYRSSAVVLLALVLGGFAQAGFARLTAVPNLLAGKDWKTSSTALVCKPLEHVCGGVVTDIFFHTNYEPSPWIQYDLGAPTKISRLRVKNRQDGLAERAAPLVAEVSDDGEKWTAVARREDKFSEWAVGFTPVTARYFRLRADKTTWLHLEEVELLP